MFILLPFIFFLLLLLEGSLTTLPVVLIFLVLLTIFKKTSWVFVLAFFSGILLDVLLLRPVGITSIVYLLILFLIRLYDRKFEIATLSFIGFAVFFASLIYLLVFQIELAILQACIVTCLTLIFVALLLRSSLRVRNVLV